MSADADGFEADNAQVCNVKTSKDIRVLVTGASGQLGSRLMICAESRQGIEVIGMSQDDLDVCDSGAVRKALELHRPDVVIHAAAYTAVDQAESEEERALVVNGHAVGWVAEACASVGASMIHISTDYVFGEVPHRPLQPEDDAQPLSAYGRTKREGELTFLQSGVNGLVVRVAWLYDAEGKNFLNTMLRLARTNGSLSVVNDQHGVPTSVPVFAEALLDLAAQKGDMPQGVWHFAHEGYTTWHGFASEIMRIANMDVAVKEVGTEAFPTPAKRPSWSVLDGEPLRAKMGWPPIHWKEGLERCWELKQDV